MAEAAGAARPAPETAPHGYVITQPVAGSDIPADLTFVLTRDEIYVPIAVRRPRGKGPFPVIAMGRGDGRGGMPHVLAEVERLVPMQDRMIARGYAVAYVNYRNEIPYLYGSIGRAVNLPDDMSGGENRTLKSAPTLDSDDLAAIFRYLRTLPYVAADAVGALGVSHGGEMILKAAADGAPLAAGVIAEGASHEFLAVDTGPSAPRKNGELQYNDVETVRARADKAAAMARIRRIRAPMLHLGRERDHLQGIFRLAYEWSREAGGDAQWACFDHPEHGYALIYPGADGAYRPDAVQQQAHALYMDFFDRHLKRRAAG